MRLPGAAILLLAAACTDTNTCDTKTVDLGNLCLPSTVAPNIPAQLDAIELCGPGCSGTPTCSALYRNGVVVVSAEQDVCTQSFSTACEAQGCLQRTLRCVLPALAAGDYPMTIPGAPPRILHVQPGGSSSCRFTQADGGI